ncbi:MULTISPECIES: hypothetical protein [unclassified Tolypothrix]|uniref:hypothetical protein n=1 Tax=unclassified Tolypothrix TaxID=2649714 RepID=UPI0005EAAF1C|nr:MULTISPECIES: hypothetical protein [unclassified Tolypothrix]BAY93496.1 hypothetical protein NIES3275_55350 [Microchaete diplosiphon NIES-3275]EKE99437.1 toxin-antitoxin system, antitoxin component, Xre family [Tolypothrix sp. PCC 7601]MBE9080798.1 DUF2281 domain-containing protein [Tolypothrix sp. LEGE 11397]UYD27335.1 DUF2281 domain-containing protein [Tolypothrix sp. PCC 7712]UYD36803.1 DUF2281 domain-containing protein [Tolypothrix sp. PCC 7601]
MTIKEQLLQEIESSPDNMLLETLKFLRFLKTQETETQPIQEGSTSAIKTHVNSTGHSLLEHLKTIGTWEGDDLEECLQLVYATRGKAKFDDDNPFE